MPPCAPFPQSSFYKVFGSSIAPSLQSSALQAQHGLSAPASTACRMKLQRRRLWPGTPTMPPRVPGTSASCTASWCHPLRPLIWSSLAGPALRHMIGRSAAVMSSLLCRTGQLVWRFAGKRLLRAVRGGARPGQCSRALSHLLTLLPCGASLQQYCNVWTDHRWQLHSNAHIPSCCATLPVRPHLSCAIQVMPPSCVMVMFAEEPGSDIVAAAQLYAAAPPGTRWAAHEGSLMLTLVGYNVAEVQFFAPCHCTRPC